MNDALLKFFKKDKFAAFVGIKLVEIKTGYAKVELEISEDHLNAVNIIQGGVIFTLADFAFAVASNSQGQVAVSINASISYFQSTKGKMLIAEAKEAFTNSKLTNYDVFVHDENNEPIAKFTGMAYRKKEKLALESLGE